MRITKQMHDEELRSFVTKGRLGPWMVRRGWRARLVQRMMVTPQVGKEIDGVHNEERFVPSRSTPGHKIRVRIFKPKNADGPLPAMLYAHAGGYLIGAPEQSLAFFQDILKQRDVVIIAPAYRLALDDPFPAGFNDCYDVLMWMKEHARELGIHADNYILTGHSAGGGIAAALTLKARDTKDVNIAFQMPIYPMIDCRMQTGTASKMTGSLIWDKKSNRFGWKHYLKGLESHAVPAYASPALNEDYNGFPPTISFVSDLEPFRDETVAYIAALEKACIPTRFKLFEGGFHGFENFAPNAAISKKANDFLLNSFAEYFDTYVNGKPAT